jgi:hypothetical protein
MQAGNFEEAPVFDEMHAGDGDAGVNMMAASSQHEQVGAGACKEQSGEVVISGVSCRLPQSDNMEEFRENLMSGVDMVTEDDSRWTPGKNLLIIYIFSKDNNQEVVILLLIFVFANQFLQLYYNSACINDIAK